MTGQGLASSTGFEQRDVFKSLSSAYNDSKSPYFLRSVRH
jgi:hypothetical protein